MKKLKRYTTLESLIDRYIFLYLERNYSEQDAINELSTQTSRSLLYLMCQKLQINITSGKK